MTITKKKDYRWKRTRTSHRRKQNPTLRAIKQADLDTLKMAEQEGITLVEIFGRGRLLSLESSQL